MSDQMLIPENIYGHAKRLGWIVSHLNQADRILEFGCGTGYMIALPLAKKGFRVTGIDFDKTSIDYGRTLFVREGLDPESLQHGDIAATEGTYDVIIASEVFEHIPNAELGKILDIISSKLKPGGKLLVTVPNGHGCFELESFLWFKTGIGRLIELLGIVFLVRVIKRYIFRIPQEDMTHVSSLAHSPHVQRFSYSSIQKLLIDNGLDVIDVRGSVLFCGPFSNLFFTGVNSIMKFNNILGDNLPKLASAFYVHARKT